MVKETPESCQKESSIRRKAQEKVKESKEKERNTKENYSYSKYFVVAANLTTVGHSLRFSETFRVVIVKKLSWTVLKPNIDNLFLHFFY